MRSVRREQPSENVSTTFAGDDLRDLRRRLGAYDILGGIDVRARLRALDVDPSERRLAELGPPQKTKKLNPQVVRSRSPLRSWCKAPAG